MVYTPYGEPVSVRLGVIRGSKARASWFDPRTGRSEVIGVFPVAGTTTFEPPGQSGRGNDWVLIVDDVAAGFGVPGQVGRQVRAPTEEGGSSAGS